MFFEKSKISKAAILKPAFIASALLLVFAATSLRPSIAALSRYYRKESIALRRPLSEFNTEKLGSFKDCKKTWTDISVKDVGTDKFLRIAFQKKNSQATFDDTLLFVTYYSDPNDQVPHTPDVCNRQQGGMMKSSSAITLPIPGPDGRIEDIPANLLLFYEPKYDVNSVFVYLFNVSGEFRKSRDQVRWEIKKPGDKHIYFSKIESYSLYPKDADPTEYIEKCKKMLVEAIPVLVNEHFPTIDQVKHR